MALDVQVRISSTSVAGRVGFGIPLILVSKASAAVAYTECSSLSEVGTACGNTSEAYKAAELLFKQDNAPEKIAVYASTGTALVALAEVIGKEWRQLIVIKGAEDETTNADIATYIEDKVGKIYYVTVSTTAELTALAGKTRTFAFYYDLKENNVLVAPNAVAAVVGATAGRAAGSFTYKNIIIKGLEPLELTDATVNQIHTGKGNTLLLKSGDVVVSNGINTDGEFLDIIDSEDWIIQQITYNSQKLLNTSDKLPYTNAGIGALESVTRGVLQEAFTNGMIATDEDGVTPLFSVDFKPRSAMSVADRQARVYSGGNFTFTLAGAIHTAEINGELII